MPPKNGGSQRQFLFVKTLLYYRGAIVEIESLV